MEGFSDDQVADRCGIVFSQILNKLSVCHQKEKDREKQNHKEIEAEEEEDKRKVIRPWFMDSLRKMFDLIDHIKDDPNLESKQTRRLVQTQCGLSGVIERLEIDRTSTMLSALDEHFRASTGDRESSSILMDDLDNVLAFTVEVLAKGRRACLVHGDSKYESVRTSFESLHIALLDTFPLLRDRSQCRVPVFMEVLQVPSNEMQEHS